ncbi:lysophospholipid acyltransferase family protein [Novosphingobium sp. JCM 18896]|uniref:lysophospholipid acyltransferase family protein n=1 Tax=Novosphingobium sp. JCM 18896 TaxID=2989731 RepID=UPI00222209D1|nr:lysophospholipid acyltransferase family protein [Novosphingobium sp. JCM 18896]MCW1430303.1 1-acyl-sn-glycerol-3-phosphate acyltransferase [Novosphingobium sp. JCM 18896]
MAVTDRASLGDVLRSLVFYVVFYLGTAGYVLGSLAALAFGRRAFITAVDGWSGFHRLCARYLLGIRVVLEGELPTEGALIALKHESFFEAIDLPHMLHRPAVIAKAELLRIPLWGLAGSTYGLIGVERDQGAKALRTMLTAARKLVAEGRVLAIFPEGTRVRHGTRPELQSGFAGLYKLLAMPVVPVAVNSGPLYHRRWKRPGTITLRVGETIPTGLPRDEIEARVRDAINALNP